MATPASHATQQTLKSAVALSGHGLFAGAPVTATLRPASAGSGIVFRRSDLPGTPDIPASIDYVIDRPRRTSLRRGEASVEMVEHCLSALSGLGVDNAVIDVNAPELPAGDGSASNFVDAIRSVGTVPQQSAREPLVVREPITVRDGEAMVTALPADGEDSEFLYVLDYGPTSPIARQVHSFTLSPVAYAEQIAPARTFSTLDEARAMWDQGFFKHLTAKEMLVIGDQGPVDNAYRLQDEPVRHKLLDMVGDLALVGRPLVGRFVAVRSGHALNHRLARELVTRFKPAGDEARTVSPVEPALDIQSILGILPHRYPMVLVDRVLEIEHGRRAVGVKNVTFNEQFFQGHYPNAPIMPGVLVIEAMCQLAGLMLHQSIEHKDRIALLLSLDNVRWRKPVTPGDQLILEAESLRCTSRLGEVQCRALVGGELVAEALAKFMVVDAKARM
jgi:UDP-3-O-[3-hydroxymyristoyl] N-acetylglucosamine deacetylase/3-hydroxyacyl-[acyl-carrier-protein] dehydratase